MPLASKWRAAAAAAFSNKNFVLLTVDSNDAVVTQWHAYVKSNWLCGRTPFEIAFGSIALLWSMCLLVVRIESDAKLSQPRRTKRAIHASGRTSTMRR